MKSLMVIMLIYMVGCGTMGSSSTMIESSTKVSGACGMCKERIEQAALYTDGVEFAEWTADTQTLKLVFNSQITSLNIIQKAIAEVGHDTELFKANPDAYNALPACCHYHENEVH